MMKRFLKNGIIVFSKLQTQGIDPGIFHSKSSEEWIDYFEKRNDISSNWLDGIEFTAFEIGEVKMNLKIEESMIAPNGFTFGGLIAHFADIACGYGCVCHFPDENSSLATTEFSCHLVDTAGIGDVIECTAVLKSQTKKSQLWDAEIVNKRNGKSIAFFRCTEIILQDRSKIRKELEEIENQ